MRPDASSNPRKIASSLAITTSHAHSIPTPPPKQPPCTRATVGLVRASSPSTARAVRRERIQLYASQQDLTRALAEARALPVGDPLRAAIEGEARVRSLPDPEQRLRELEALLAAPASPAQAFRLRFDVAQVLLELRRYAELEDELERMHALRPDSPLIPFLRYLRYNTERNYPEVTRALDEGLAYERDPEQAAMLGWLRVQSLWLSGDKVRSRAAREALLREGPPAAGVIPLAAQISAVVQQPADALAFAEAGRANPALSPEGRWTCLRVSIEVLRASGAWAELRTLIEGLEGEPLPPDLFQTLAEAHAEATRALEGR